MNKGILCGIAGFILGVGTGAIIVHNIQKKIINKLMDKNEELEDDLNRKTKLADAAIHEITSRVENIEYKELIDPYIVNEEDDCEVDEYGEPIDDEPEMDFYPISRYDEYGEEMEEITIQSTKPYPIPPEEFEAYDEYESDGYTWYPDGFVTDSDGLPVDPGVVKELFGVDFPLWFGKYAPDEVWIRNDERRMDFSIVRDAENFEDIATPRQRKLAGL